MKNSGMGEKANGTAQPNSHANIKYPWWFGGSASCFAVCLTHPLDLSEYLCPNGTLSYISRTSLTTPIVKVRMQAAQKGPNRLGSVGTAIDVVKKDGIPGLYRGVRSSALQSRTPY